MKNAQAPNLSPDMIEKILSAVDGQFQQQIENTQKLIEFPSQRGHEQSAQDYVYQLLDQRGYSMDRWLIDIDSIKDHPGFSPVSINYDQAFNIVATHTPREQKGRSLILNGHIDVVPTGPEEMWSTPPYEAKVEGDWLYGRGSGDMKAGLIANIAALDALRSIGYQPAATVFVQSVTEEECTGNGSLSCLVQGYTAEAALIPEPAGEDLVRANVGVIWFKVRVKGLPVHVLDAGAGANAIEAMFPIITALHKLEDQWNAKKSDYPHFADTKKPMNISVGKIKGGDWASSVPAWCEIDVRASIYPGTPPQEAAAEIEACVKQACLDNPFLSKNPAEIDYNGFFCEGYILEEGSEAERTLAYAHKETMGRSLNSKVLPGYLDARVFSLYGDCKALVYGPVTRNIHGFDECVSLSSVQRVTGTIALFIAQWCELEKID